MLGTFFGVLGFYKRLQVGQTGLPEDAILLQPGIDRFQRFRIELVEAVSALAPFLHQMGTAQQSQVFRDGRPRNRKRPRNLSGRLSSLPQEIKHSPSGRIREYLKSRFRGIRNRTVSHNA
jgi:hypothetical protein